jgi:hypothetical protein
LDPAPDGAFSAGELALHLVSTRKRSLDFTGRGDARRHAADHRTRVECRAGGRPLSAVSDRPFGSLGVFTSAPVDFL